MMSDTQPVVPLVDFPDEHDASLSELLADPPQAEPSPPPAEQLVKWLCALVYGHEYGLLADLRRPTAVTRARLIAASYAPDELQRPIYENVAFLFARYHAGRATPHRGFGTMGDVLRRIGSPGALGVKDAGACRLLDRLVASRHIPQRHLQHAVERCRACDTPPPSWVQLVRDLCAWTSRQRDVRYEWARCFYTPNFTQHAGSNQ